MKVYISGRMSGLPDSNYPAFHAAAAAWRAAGWTVENPAEHFGGAANKKYIEYVECDAESLKTCDAIAMLPGWDDPEARGSIWERQIAISYLGIPVLDAMNPVPPEFLEGVYSYQLRNFINEVVPAPRQDYEPTFSDI